MLYENLVLWHCFSSLFKQKGTMSFAKEDYSCPEENVCFLPTSPRSFISNYLHASALLCCGKKQRNITPKAFCSPQLPLPFDWKLCLWICQFTHIPKISAFSVASSPSSSCGNHVEEMQWKSKPSLSLNIHLKQKFAWTRL